MAVQALGPIMAGGASGGTGGGMAALGGAGGGGAAGGGIFSDLITKLGARGFDKATGADFLAGLESISQGNAAAQIAAGQSAAAGGGVSTPGVDIMSSLTAQDTAANLSARSALDEFKKAKEKKEMGANARIAKEAANA